MATANAASSSSSGIPGKERSILTGRVGYCSFEGPFVKYTENTDKTKESKIVKFTSDGVTLKDGKHCAYETFGNKTDGTFVLYKDEEQERIIRDKKEKGDTNFIEQFKMHFVYFKQYFHTIVYTALIRDSQGGENERKKYWEKITNIFLKVVPLGLQLFKSANEKEKMALNLRDGSAQEISVKEALLKSGTAKHVQNGVMLRGAVRIVGEDGGLAKEQRRYANNVRPNLRWTLRTFGLLPTEPLVVNIPKKTVRTVDYIINLLKENERGVTKENFDCDEGWFKIYERMIQRTGEVSVIDVLKERYTLNPGSVVTCVDGNHRVELIHQANTPLQVSVYKDLSDDEAKALSSAKSAEIFQSESISVLSQLAWFLHTLIPECFGKVKIEKNDEHVLGLIQSSLCAEGSKKPELLKFWFIMAYNEPMVFSTMLQFGSCLQMYDEPLNFVNLFGHFQKFNPVDQPEIVQNVFSVLLLGAAAEQKSNISSSVTIFKTKTCREVVSRLNHTGLWMLQKVFFEKLINKDNEKKLPKDRVNASVGVKWNYVKTANRFKNGTGNAVKECEENAESLEYARNFLIMETFKNVFEQKNYEGEPPPLVLAEAVSKFDETCKGVSFQTRKKSPTRKRKKIDQVPQTAETQAAKKAKVAQEAEARKARLTARDTTKLAPVVAPVAPVAVAAAVAVDSNSSMSAAAGPFINKAHRDSFFKGLEDRLKNKRAAPISPAGDGEEGKDGEEDSSISSVLKLVQLHYPVPTTASSAPVSAAVSTSPVVTMPVSVEGNSGMSSTISSDKGECVSEESLKSFATSCKAKSVNMFLELFGLSKTNVTEGRAQMIGILSHLKKNPQEQLTKTGDAASAAAQAASQSSSSQ